MARTLGYAALRVFEVGILLTAFLLAPLSAQLGGAGVNVLTWHNDNGRTGQNLNETTVLYNNLSTFGQLCSAQLDGQVYAQPLLVSGVPWGPNAVKNVVYVVTQNDTLYAINGTLPAG